MRATVVLVALLVLAACAPEPGTAPAAPAASGASGASESPAASAETAESPEAPAFPPAPSTGDAPVAPEVAAALDRVVASVADDGLDREALAVVAASRDARLGWLVADLLRFLQGGPHSDALLEAFATLTGWDPRDDGGSANAWGRVTDVLIAWDLPAAPGYQERKGRLFTALEPGWEPFFADADATVDWRHLSWGGVLIDDRELGATGPCLRGCIPALDDPALTAADSGGWYPDDGVVFGVVVGDDAVALPRNVMEVHEMVNLTLGGRRLGIPYCTLCGSAQAYVLDGVGETTPVLRTSGLLTRSNKVMYDLETSSVIDTFTGEARSGPLQDAGVVLEQLTVVTTTWGQWRSEHPDTRIVAEDGGIGRSYPLDPLRGRDDDGPIFPIGPVDERLPVQSQVLGVVAPDGTPIAFPVDQALAALEAGEQVAVANVVVRTDGGGLRAAVRGGEELAAHQAFWFAWSQFHPETEVWVPLGG